MWHLAPFENLMKAIEPLSRKLTYVQTHKELHTISGYFITHPHPSMGLWVRNGLVGEKDKQTNNFK